MDSINEFHIEQQLRDRFTEIERVLPQTKMSEESMEDVCKKLAKIVVYFNKLVAEEGNTKKPVLYLIDKLGYYMRLMYETQALNDELIHGLQNMIEGKDPWEE